MTTNIYLHRVPSSFIRGTAGIIRSSALDAIGAPPIFTLELPWLDNRRNRSCIPTGTYTIAPYQSDKFQRAFEVKDVPNRSSILIHPGNRLSEIRGCILVGLKLCVAYSISYSEWELEKSAAALDWLMQATNGTPDPILLTIEQIKP